MNKILVIDIETTGFSVEKDVIVEIGIVSLNLDTGEIQTIYNKVVKDDRFNLEYHVERENHGWIFENTKLTVQDVLEGAPLKDETLIIQNILDSHPLGATPFNNTFDFSFLEEVDVELPVKLGCPMKLSRDIVGALNKKGTVKNPSVQEAYDFFFPNSWYTEQHRGADDAEHEAEIVYELYKRGVFTLN